MNKHPLSNRLCYPLCALFFLGNCTIFLPFNHGASAGFQGLCLAVASGIIFTVFAFKYLNIKHFYPNKFGIGFGALFCALALLTAAETAADFTLVTNAEILTDKNHFVFSLVFSLLILFILKCEKTVLFKMSLIFLVLISFSEIVLFLTSLNQFDFSNVAKLNSKGTIPQFLYFFSKSVAPLFVLPIVLNGEKVSIKGACFGLLSAFVLILLPLTQILLIFGPAYAETLQFPFITVLDTVSVGLKYSRLEGLAFVIFFFGAITKCSVLLFCVKEILNKLFKSRSGYFPYFLSLFLFLAMLFSKKIVALYVPLNLIISFGSITIVAVGLLKSHIHCQCKTK